MLSIIKGSYQKIHNAYKKSSAQVSRKWNKWNSLGKRAKRMARQC